MTISHLARKHGLSRSTLLYYDRIGLLRPVGRLGNSYRHYTAADDKRLGQICLYRRTGLPLAEIGRLLERPRRDLAGALERQLHDLLAQIEAMRNRQRLIVELLKDRRLLEQVRPMTKEKWVRLLRTSGFTDKDDIGFFDLNIILLGFLYMEDPLVVIINSHCKQFLGFLLTDHIQVKMLFYFHRF